MEKQDKLEILPLEVRKAPPRKSPTVTNKASRALHPTFAP